MRDLLLPVLLAGIAFGLSMLIIERVPWLQHWLVVLWPW